MVRSQLILAGKVLLVAVTLVCLASMGGAMLYAFPVLVPLHWLAARSAEPLGRLGWAFLAAASLYEAGWMLTYMATRQPALSLAVGGVAGAVGAVVVARTRPPDAPAVAETGNQNPPP